MFDFASSPAPVEAAPVLFLSGPMGVAREWTGVAGCLGRHPAEAFEDVGAFQVRLAAASEGAHVVAYGTACHDVLGALCDAAVRIRSVTLVDPDVMAALPDFNVMPSVRSGVELRRRVAGFAATGDLPGAAEAAVDAAMGQGAFARSSVRLQARFVGRIRRLVGAWRAQTQRPLALYRLSARKCPTLVVTGRAAPADYREAARLLDYCSPAVTRLLVSGAGACAHLTDPHVVGPAMRKFVAEADALWQTSSHEALAA